MSYATRWARIWSVLAALGVGLAVVEWSAPTTLITVAVTTALVATVSMALTNGLWTPTGGRGHVLLWSLGIGSGAVAALAIVTASPALGLLVAILAVGTAPPLLARLSALMARRDRDRWAHDRPVPPPGPRAEATAGPPIGSPSHPPATLSVLSDEQLCLLWRHTFWKLHDEESVDERMATVALRQACLEELERRDPAALAAWLSSGARASGGPERFLHPRTDSDGNDAA
jgi:hypothetical protein